VLKGAQQDPQLITSTWHRFQEPIEGVVVREVLHVPGERGTLTELYRREWDAGGSVEHVFHVALRSRAISAWHCHLKATDRLFALSGCLRIVLFDARADSASRGRINEFTVGAARPTLVVVPPEVWHGVQNLDASPAGLVNMPSHAYSYESPDHYRVPADSPEVPYTWRPGGATADRA
jgi:dTDP-4-dehydrorhamnose 3,5-epimerase